MTTDTTSSSGQPRRRQRRREDVAAAPPMEAVDRLAGLLPQEALEDALRGPWA